MSRSYYDVLGVPPDADAERIRDAYRERVKEVHPDVSDHPDSADRFRLLSTAKDVLCDPTERARYDRLGHARYTGEAARTGMNEAESTRTSAGESGAEQRRTADSERRRRARTRADARASTADSEPGFDGEAWWRTDGAAWDTSTREGATATASGTGRSWYGTGADDGSGYRVTSRRDSTVRFTTERALLAVAVFFCYPLLLGVTVFPAFGFSVRVAAGVCALFVVAGTLSVPEAAVLVFGALTVVAPMGLAAGGVNPFSLTGVVAWAFCWVPLVIGGANLFALRT